MKKLVLMRHGHTYSAFQSGVDCDAKRPLSEDGAQDARKAAERLKEKNIKPDIVVTSTLLRAAQTAQEVCRVLGCSALPHERLCGAFGAADVWKDCIAPCFDKADTVLVVGHQPGHGIIAGTLLGQGELSLPPGGFYVINLASVPPELAPGCATLDFAYL